MSAPAASLETSLCGIKLRNPVIAASGTFAYGIEFAKLLDLNALGGLVVKGLSREPIEGNPPPRVYETEAGMINSIGLQNIGVRAFVKEKLPELARLKTAVFANVFGYQTADYVEVVRVLEDHAGLAGWGKEWRPQISRESSADQVAPRQRDLKIRPSAWIEAGRPGARRGPWLPGR